MTVPPQLTIEDVLKRIAAGVAAGQFRVVLFGGCALPFYGVERLTLDIDVMMTDNDTNAFAVWMGEMGYQQVQRTPQCAKFRHSVGEARLPDIDTVFVDAPVMDKIWTDSAIPLPSPLPMTQRPPAAVAALPDLPMLTGPCPEVRLLGSAACFRALDSVRHWLPDWQRSQQKRLVLAVAPVRFVT